MKNPLRVTLLKVFKIVIAFNNTEQSFFVKHCYSSTKLLIINLDLRKTQTSSKGRPSTTSPQKMIKNAAKWRSSKRDNLHLRSNPDSTHNFYNKQNTIKKQLKQLYWNQTSAWVFSCKFAAYSENTFS